MTLLQIIHAGLMASVHGSRLDRELATGVPPDSSPVLRARARQLSRDTRRRRIAARLEAIVNCVDHSKADPNIGQIYDRASVEAARPLLLELVQRLREPERPNPRGIAAVAWLVSDTDSPVFVPGGRASGRLGLSSWAEQALIWLDLEGSSPRGERSV